MLLKYCQGVLFQMVTFHVHWLSLNWRQCRFLRKAAEVERLRVDIKDFDPAGLPQLRTDGCQWIAFGKHLCGAATDFTLRCCGRLAGEGAPPARGLAVATCCHHRCSWEHFTGSDAFLQLGFSPEEFEIVSWMTGMPRSRPFGHQRISDKVWDFTRIESTQ